MDNQTKNDYYTNIENMILKYHFLSKSFTNNYLSLTVAYIIYFWDYPVTLSCNLCKIKVLI